MAKKKTRVLLPGGIQGLVHDLQNGGIKNAPQTVEEEENTAQNSDAGSRRQPADTQRDNTQNRPNGENTRQQPENDRQELENQTDRVGEETPGSAAATPSENRAQSFNPAHASVQANHEPSTATAQPPSAAVQSPSAAVQTSTSTVQPSQSAPGTPLSGSAANRPIGSAASTERAYSPGRPVKQNTMKEYHIVKDDSRDSWDLFLDMAKQYKDGGGRLATIYIDSTLKNVLDRMKYVGTEKLPTSAMLSSIVARFIYDHEDEIRKALFSGNLI